MPRIEPRAVQRELEQGRLWPVYWLFGHERMKSRELLKRIRKTALGSGDGAVLLGMAEETFDATEIDSGTILDAALSPSLGGGVRLIVVRDAHALKNPETLDSLFGPSASREEIPSVCVFVSKDLDGRKKFSKTLLEKAAVVPCEEVAEGDREEWILYLARSRKLEPSPELVAQLTTLDPWNLDIIDQEFEKLSLAGDEEALLCGGGPLGGGPAFVEAFLSRDIRSAMERVGKLADSDESFALLGLLGWNVRQLALVVGSGGREQIKLPPAFADRFRRWRKMWELREVLELQARLADLDFKAKQTPLSPLGLWSSLVSAFCR
jgi:DNA polymerase III delta subunit